MYNKIMRGQKKRGDIMAPRTGRPPLHKTSRNKSLNIRLTEQEKNEIQFCAEKLNISRTDAIMKGIRLLSESSVVSYGGQSSK